MQLKSRRSPAPFNVFFGSDDSSFLACPSTLAQGLPVRAGGKESACNAGDTGDLGLIPGPRRSPGEGNGNPLQYSCLENSMERGTWKATVHGVAKCRTQLSDSHTHTPASSLKAIQKQKNKARKMERLFITW